MVEIPDNNIIFPSKFKAARDRLTSKVTGSPLAPTVTLDTKSLLRLVIMSEMMEPFYKLYPELDSVMIEFTLNNVGSPNGIKITLKRDE